MSKKKEQKVPVTQADEAQASSMLEQYRQIARELHTSTDQQQAETALTAITSMSEATQMALLKLLSKEQQTDAADVLAAINELSPNKNVRKEARRSLIRLEQARIYPQWEPPIDRTPLIATVQTQDELDVLANPPRFWKGQVTDSRDIGEVQLMLMWEQGKDYKYVRIMGFLLEFWRDGVKDFFTKIDSKRNMDRLIAETSAKVDLVDCSLAKGRRLIQEALDVNKKSGTMPHRDYRLSLSLVNQLVLENPNIEEEEDDTDEETLDLTKLEPAQIVTNFVEAWVDEDYEFAYEFLSSNSSLREGLTQEEWAERRQEWADEAQPANLKPNFLHEREPQKSGIWLPNPFSRGSASAQKEIEIGWSIELADTSDIVDSIPLPELPQGTAFYKETGRHWFWTSYTLVEEDGWRIQSMTNEGINALALPTAELEKRLSEHTKRIENITKQHSPEDADSLTYFDEILWRSMQSIYYYDALLKHFPLDRELHMVAASSAGVFGDRERSLVYLERAAEQFSEGRGEILRQIGAAQMVLSEKYFEMEDDEDEVDDEDVDYEVRGTRFRDLAEATFRELLMIENSVSAHVLLADVLVDRGEDEDLDEAEDHFHQAQALTSNQSDLTILEMRLGDVEMEREEYEKALSHYQRAVEMDPTLVSGWHDVGEAHRMLGNDEEAVASYKRATKLQPDNIDCYGHIADIYVKNEQIAEAREVLEGGLQANPDSTELLMMLSATYIHDGDFDRAEELLDKAEEIDPDDESMELYRQVIAAGKQQSKRRPLFLRKNHKKK